MVVVGGVRKDLKIHSPLRGRSAESLHLGPAYLALASYDEEQGLTDISRGRDP